MIRNDRHVGKYYFLVDGTQHNTLFHHKQKIGIIIFISDIFYQKLRYTSEYYIYKIFLVRNTKLYIKSNHRRTCIIFQKKQN